VVLPNYKGLLALILGGDQTPLFIPDLGFSFHKS